MRYQTKNLRLTLVSPVVAALALFLGVAPSSPAAIDTWTGASGANWSAPGNWTGGNAPPVSGDSLVFNTSSGTTTLHNDLTALATYGITFTGSGFTLNGNSLLISGNTNGTNLGIINSSGGSPQIIGMNLTVDWGYYTFTGNYGSPNGLALNGTMTINPGGIAEFDPFVTSSSLATDGTGLIAGLDGAGLMYTGNTPTGLATISGGSIQAYANYTTLASGAISSGNNIELTASGTSAYTSGGITVNTITTTQTGNGNSLATTTINNTGLLTLGNNGGIYALDSAAGARGVLVLSGGNLTAGVSGTPATMILGANGNNSTNQLQIASIIQDNGVGGAVAVVTTGTGTQNFTKVNTYSGGTYITQGELQGTGALGCFGVGPVYIAGGASARLGVAGTWSNNFYLSPGLGDTTSGAILNEGAIDWESGVTLSGTLTLLGPPATTGHGDRISGNDTGGSAVFSGQITGTGTLEIGGAHSVGAITLANTNTNALNNWQGGLILNANTGVAVNTFFKMGALNQMPFGANAGNVTLIPATTAVSARFDLNGWNTTINGIISTTGGAEANLANFGTTNCTVTLGANDTTASFAGSVSDSGNGKALSVVKIGAGMQTFTGVLSHFGNTTVSNGIFELQNTIANSSNIIVAAAGTLDASQGPGGGLTVAAKQTLTGTGTVQGATSINGTLAPGLLAVSGASTNIGALTNNGSVTLFGGCTNFWYVNNAGGAAGAASGWSLLNIISNNSLTLNNASLGTPIYLKIVSLNGSGSPGNATFNPNLSQQWTLAQSTAPINGFTGSSQFLVDTSAFSNLPSASSQFSVNTNAAGNSLVLNFVSTPVITSGLVSQTNNAGTTAVYTVSAGGATPITYQWIEGGSLVLFNGGGSAGGGSVTITTNGAGTSSTLMIAGVQDADAGNITVNVTNNAGANGSSTATLTVIDPPVNPYLTQSGATEAITGGITYLTVATSGGTMPFSYIWSHNGSVIAGATGSNYGVQISPGALGSYTVIVSNQAGSVTNAPFVLNGPVTSVPNQLIYDNFDSYGQMGGPSAPYTWQGVTNVFNQLTGEPAYWYHYSGSRVSMVISGNTFSSFTANGSPGYPWPGLAGNSQNCMYMEVSSSSTDNDHLQFWNHGLDPGVSLYFSFILSCYNTGTANIADCIAAFCSSADGTSFNLKLSTQIQTDGSYWLGLSKGSGVTGNQGVDANTLWVTNFQPLQDVFVVGVYQANSNNPTNTDDTVAMWFNPTNASFGTTNVPTPTLGPSTFGVSNSDIHTFAIHGVQLPGFRYFSDLRIGTTWASVTPTSAPELLLNNQVLTPTVVLASQNAGNPVNTYQWYSKGNATALTDGANTNGDGSTLTGSSTSALTITGAEPADLGLYTVTGSNIDPAPGDNGATLTGSASALLTALPPRLSIANSPPDVILTWPTNWPVVLEVSTNLLPPVTWTTVTGATVSGTNYTATVVPGSTNSLYFQLAP